MPIKNTIDPLEESVEAVGKSLRRSYAEQNVNEGAIRTLEMLDRWITSHPDRAYDNLEEKIKELKEYVAEQLEIATKEMERATKNKESYQAKLKKLKRQS